MYSLKEVAKILSVHYNTVYRYVQQGTIKAVLVGGVWRVPEEEIQKIKEGKQ